MFKDKGTLLQRLFNKLPIKVKCLFGRCKEVCGGLAMEDNIEEVRSLGLRAHLKLCKSCSNYYNQMLLVNQQVKAKLSAQEKVEFSTEQVQAQEKSVVDAFLNL